MKNRVIFSIIIFLSTNAVALANSVSLSQALSSALSFDPQYRAAINRTAAAEESLVQASARLAPNISASSSFNLVNQSRQDGSSPPLIQNFPSYNIGLVLRQTVFNKTLVSVRDQAKFNIDGSQAILSSEQQALAVRLAEAYVSLALSTEQEEEISLQIDSMNSRADAARRAFEVGVGTRTDIDELKAQTDILQAQLLGTRQATLSHRSRVSQISGLSVLGSVKLGENIQKLRPVGLENLQVWIERLSTSNPLVLLRRAQAKSATESFNISKHESFPKIDLVAQSSRSSSENTFFVNTKTTAHILGLQINIPLYQGGELQSRERQALAELRAAEDLVEQAVSETEAELRRTVFQLSEGLARADALESAIISAQQVVISNQRSFQVGLRSLLDILNAEQRVSRTRLELAQAKAQVVLSWVQLYSLIGAANPSQLQFISDWFDVHPR